MERLLRFHPKTSVWVAFCWAALAGATASLGMAPHALWPMTLAGLAGLFYLQNLLSRPWQCFVAGWIFSFLYFLISLRWIGNALLVAGNDYAWAYPLAVSGLPLFLALFTALACFGAKCMARQNFIHNFLGLFACLAAAEWLRGVLFTGFPWNLYGYAWAGVPEILQSLPLIRTYGLSVLTIFWAGYLAASLSCDKMGTPLRILAVAVLALQIGLLYAYGYAALAKAPAMAPQAGLTLRLIQPNIDQAAKWQRDKAMDNYKALLSLSLPRKDDQRDNQHITWIVWPETAISLHHLNNPLTREMLVETLKTYIGPVYLITGILLRNPEDGSFSNSLVILDKNAEIIARYDKSHLVPFGEYIPLQGWIPLETITQFSGFRPGKGLSILTLPENQRISPLICYEILFSGRVIPANTDKPDYIVNVTNDAWYGLSDGPEQHLIKARFRAIEERIPVIRVANTGYTALIDPYGRYVIKSGLFEKGSYNF